MVPIVSVIIPHHKETLDDMDGLFSSLNCQVGVDFNQFEIIVCNDEKDAVIEDYSRYKNLSPIIRNVFTDVSGSPGLNRQTGIDSSKGEYLLFFDADDECYISSLFFDLLSRIQNEEFDVFSYGFIEELKTNGVTQFIVHEPNRVWVFAKLYRKSFLTRHNIRFTPKLKYHEDTYFNGVLWSYNPKVVYGTYSGYVWRWNVGSITRRQDGSYTVNSLPEWIDANSYCIDDVYGKVSPDICLSIMIGCVSFIYSEIQKNKMPEVMKEYRQKIEETLAAFIDKYDGFDALVSQQLAPTVAQIVANHLQGLLVTETFYGFVERLRKLVKKQK